MNASKNIHQDAHHCQKAKICIVQLFLFVIDSISLHECICVFDEERCACFDDLAFVRSVSSVDGGAHVFYVRDHLDDLRIRADAPIGFFRVG